MKLIKIGLFVPFLLIFVGAIVVMLQDGNDSFGIDSYIQDVLGGEDGGTLGWQTLTFQIFSLFVPYVLMATLFIEFWLFKFAGYSIILVYNRAQRAIA